MADPPTQGPKAGATWPAEAETYRDPTTGARVRRLTGHPGAGDRHLYFTTDGWYDGGRRLLLRTDRSGSSQLFSVDLETGLFTQVTDLEGFGGGATVGPDGDLFCWVDDRVVRLDLDRLTVTDVVYAVPEGYQRGTFDVSADGETVYVSMDEPVDLPGEDSTLREKAEAAPDTRLVAVPLDGGEGRVFHEEAAWVSTHMDASPTVPKLVMYPRQGPWDTFEDKVWVHDVSTGERWSVRSTPGDCGVGHQHWLADGERVGYHGWCGPRSDPESFYGHARYDGTDRVETEIPVRQTHCHTNDPSAFVCDGSSEVATSLYYEWDEATGAYGEPRRLATHDWRPDGVHPHSRLSPDGSQVVFDSARYQGDCDVFLVDVPADPTELPVFEGA